MIRLLAHPPPVSKLSLFLSLAVFRRSSFLTGFWKGGEGAISYDREKAMVIYKLLYEGGGGGAGGVFCTLGIVGGKYVARQES
jgi:hypothetical protein